MAFAAHKKTTLDAVTTLIRNPSMLLVLGVVTLAAGLAIVLAHNVWSGGALPAIVTLVGWISIAKGLSLLLFPPNAFVALMESIHYSELFYLDVAISFVIGLYLTIGGFNTAAR